MELKNGWKRRSLLDSIIFRLYVKLWGCMVKTSRLWQTTKYIHYPHWSIRDLRGSKPTVSPVLDWEIHDAHHPCLRMPPPNWIKMSLSLSLDLHKSINWKKTHRSFVKFYQRLREATKWTHGQKRTSDSFVSIFFWKLFSSKDIVVYIGIIHDFWLGLLDHYYLSLPPLSNCFGGFFSFPTTTLRAWSVPELFHWVQFDTWQHGGLLGPRERKKRLEVVRHSQQFWWKKITVLPNATKSSRY